MLFIRILAVAYTPHGCCMTRSGLFTREGSANYLCARGLKKLSRYAANPALLDYALHLQDYFHK